MAVSEFPWLRQVSQMDGHNNFTLMGTRVDDTGCATGAVGCLRKEIIVLFEGK